MVIGIALVLVGVAGITFLALKRASSGREIDAGQVSESWLREQRTEKREHFP